jgi:two-component system alkaline phosphatase synthesis response regulator PhoP
LAVREQNRESKMGKKVMVIDDDDTTVKFVTILLSENGFETLSAQDGREGMELLKQNDVDLIILDVMMPKKTGFVLFKQLKRDEKLRNIPVLMLTGVAASLADLDGQSEDTFERPFDSLRESLRKNIQEMRETGEVKPDMFVDKPIEPEAFIQKVRDLTSG